MKENSNTLEDIYIKYKKDIYSYLYYRTSNKDTAEELCHEVFLRAFKAFSGFKGKSSVKTWLYSIAHNAYVTWYKREIRYDMVSINTSVIEEIESYDGQPEAAVESIDNRQAVLRVLNDMKDEYKNVLVLSEIQQLSYEEIANTLSWDMSKVKTTLYRARIQFKLKYSKEGDCQ